MNLFRVCVSNDKREKQGISYSDEDKEKAKKKNKRSSKE